MQELIVARLQKAIADDVFTAVSVGVVTVSGQPTYVSQGSFRAEGVDIAVTENSIFDVASVTKSIPVATLALFLIDTEKLSLDDHVSKILPELQTTYKDEITIRHLLTQTLDFQTSLSRHKHESPDIILKHILTSSFRVHPGEKLHYANATSILLGMVIERVTGKTLDTLARQLFFTPLHMHSTSFHPESLQGQIVPTEIDPWRGDVLQGVIHDESAYILSNVMIPGSAGLFSTVSDLLRFLEMIINGGMSEGKRFLSESIIHQMSTNQLRGIGEVGGLGWEMGQSRYMGEYASERTIAKTGFTGCLVVADREQQKAMVMLSNYHYPKRKISAEAINSVRRDIADIVLS